MRVLVTGGAGFIGSHVVDKLRLRGHEPVIFDLIRSPHHGPGEVPTITGSITDRRALERGMTGCEAVIHLAAVADVNDVQDDPAAAEETNARGTLVVLEAARRAGVRRVVYGSTIWVYSDCPETSVDEDTPIPSPAHLYTATKLAGEMYGRSYAEAYGLECTTLRFGIPYGPRARAAGVVPAFVRKALAGEPLTVAGDGGQFRRFVYVEDLADGVALGLEPVAANRVYNLASDETVTILEVAQTVRELVGDTDILHTEGRPGDFGGKEVSSERAERELGWRAGTPFDEGVRRYLAWHQATASANGGAPASGTRARSDDGAPVVRDRAPVAGGEEEAPSTRVLILSTDIGEGHDLPARALAADVAAEDAAAAATVVDGLAAMGRLLTIALKDNSRFVFRWIPWLFNLQYWVIARFPPTRWVGLRVLYVLGARRLLRLIRSERADVVVSTYPGVTAVLGELRRRRRLDIPAYSAITDLAALRFWAHPGIDRHFVTHRESIEEVESIAGPGSARWTRPPTSPRFMVPRPRRAARRALGLPEEGTVIVVSGGGWAVGDLTGAIEVALGVQDATVVALCGRGEHVRDRLERSFGEEPRVRLLGFTEEMSDLLAAADALVHSTAGLTVLEALMRGCPVVSYGFAVGHVKVNNAALARFGLAQVAGSREELDAALRAALELAPEPDTSFAALPAPGRLVLAGHKRVRPLPAWRLRLARAPVVTAAIAGALVLSLSSASSYRLLANRLDIGPLTAVATTRPQVGVVIDASPRQLPVLARQLARRHVHGSFAVVRPLDPATVHTLRALRDEALPKLRAGSPFRWLRNNGQLRRTARDLGLVHHYFYVVPDKGLNFGQYMLAHAAGASPVTGAVHLSGRAVAGSVRGGEVLEVRIPPRAGMSSPALASLLDALRRRGLEAVPVGVLVRGRARETRDSG